MIELLLLIGGVIAFMLLNQRQQALSREVDALRDRLMRLDPGMAAHLPTADAPPRRAATVRSASPPVIPAPETLPQPTPEPERALEPEPEPERGGFETLVGGKLPIWTGGAALVVAGFFLVRYSIESGLLGPTVRVVLAALFSALLIGASEVARNWTATRDDPRVGQALAGAGVASGYGTLYIAAAQYHLVGPVAGFALMLAITGIALWLALRHGPPTAIMALVGGFAAPLVAGFDAAGLGALLVYLALFTAALFALAIRRGWTWLAIAALVAGFGWANLLVVLLEGRDAGGVAAFVTALAIGATLALPRTGATARWLRAAPIVAGLLQLLVLAPTLEFGALAWSFYLVLSGAALVLAWRDAVLRPGALAAALLVLVLLTGGFLQMPVTAATSLAAVIATAMFALAGFALSRTDRSWAQVALLGIAGPVLVAHACATELLAAPAWALLELVAAGGAGLLAWRHRERARSGDAGLVDGVTVAAALAAIGIGGWAGAEWAAVPTALAMAAVALIAHRMGERRLAERPAAFLLAALALAGTPLVQFAEVIASALGGTPLTYPLLPPIGDVLRLLALTAVAALAILRLPDGFGRARKPAAAIGAGLALLTLYALAKQPLAIADAERFVALGFGERAVITLAILAAGWWLVRRAPSVGTALVALGLARIAAFDLVLLNPVFERQAVGAIPMLNAAVLLPALAAAALMTLPVRRPWRVLGMMMSVVAVAAAVRQVAHGTILTGDLGTGENWGYSAAFLLLAMAWLAAGIRSGARDLRLAGLALLTLVTLKVFLIDVAALGGLLRILSFLGLGVALIGIGWAYGRVLAPKRAPTPSGSAGAAVE